MTSATVSATGISADLGMFHEFEPGVRRADYDFRQSRKWQPPHAQPLLLEHDDRSLGRGVLNGIEVGQEQSGPDVLRSPNRS